VSSQGPDKPVVSSSSQRSVTGSTGVGTTNVGVSDSQALTNDSQTMVSDSSISPQPQTTEAESVVMSDSGPWSLLENDLKQGSGPLAMVQSVIVPVTPKDGESDGGSLYVYCIILLVFCFISVKKRYSSSSLNSVESAAKDSAGLHTLSATDPSADEEVSIILVLSDLRMPFSLFIILLSIYRLIPFLSMGYILSRHIEWLRLIVALAGVNFATAAFMVIFVDYFLIIVQGAEIPRIFYQILKIATFILIGLPVLSTGFGLDITPFLTTSAVLTMVIGLALQDSLGNLFSGIAMQVSNPFKVGDWVLLAGNEGRIREVNWRATTIKTFSNDFLILPNTCISSTEIKNFSRPTRVHARYVQIGLSYCDSPEKVRTVLSEAASGVDGILSRPVPQIMLRNYNDFTIDYVIKFFILDYAKYPVVESDLREAIWYALKRNSMEIPFPVRTIEKAKEPDIEKEMNARYNLLVAVDFLQAISDSGLKELISLLRTEIYPPGYKIVSYGGMGDTFYIIREGSAEILVPDNSSGNESELKVATLGSSQYFGEMSLLTGEARNATVKTITEVKILSLDKEVFRSILRKEPKLAEKISTIIISRKRATEEALVKNKGSKRSGNIGSGTTVAKRDQEIERQNLLNKIVHFFGM
jgi:small-conductance mechanosensitive channel